MLQSPESVLRITFGPIPRGNAVQQPRPNYQFLCEYAFSHAEWQAVQRMLEWLEKNWQRPDDGIWQVRGGAREFLRSRVMCWVAFDRALRLAQKRSLSAPLDRWQRTRDEIRNDVL